MARKPTAKKRTSKKPVAHSRRWFVPYPLMVFLLLAAGAFLTAWTFRVDAQDILVTARIQGPALTGPATITSPADGTHFSAVPITVEGSCPTNAAYVEIFRNGLMGGSGICSAGGTFSLSTDLFDGRNDLTAHSFNITDDEGPVSTAVSVFYDAPPPPVLDTGQPNLPEQASQNASSAVQKHKKAPLTLKTSFVYKGYYIGQQVDWPLEVSGGSEPYALNVDWGDGKNSIISRKTSGQFTISHVYATAGGYKGSYIVKVQASDTESAYSYLEFFVIVNAKEAVPGIGNIYNKPPPTIGGLRHLLWIAWPVYVLVILMAVAYKLGEREELLVLRKRGMLRR